ncbi:MAG TPA: thioredoxin domain-containing protein [Thermoanaerobaculia bacterium]|nr:thioredoxin domain-containing protein [Thermoanaerobaculia bacterium]
MHTKVMFAVAASLLLTGSGMAQTAEKRALTDTRVAELVRASVPLCLGETTLSESPFERTFPTGMKAKLIRIDSKNESCRAELIAITTERGNAYIGRPWFLDKYEGKPEQKLKSFIWEGLHEAAEVTIDASRNSEGMRRVLISQTTEYGKIPIRGVINEEGTMFLTGDFVPMKGDYKATRLTEIDKLIAASPSTGPARAPVSIVEFSDFQCPACRRSAMYMKPILKKYGDAVRYTRFDLPLMSHHPWAFPAAVAGRAIHRQNPDKFWLFKDAVYDNQEKLNAFTLADFARGFAQDHDLDLARYDADAQSAAVLQQILDGVGASFNLQLHGTPSYLVNGTLVEAGLEGEGIDRFIAAQLAAQKTVATK